MLEKIKNNHAIENLLLLFILAQPVLDLITSLAITYLKTEFTAGIFIRFAMMLLGAFYIFFIADSKNKRKSIIYILVLGLFLILGFINNLMVKSPVSPAEEIKFILKTVYFVILFYSYMIVFKQLKSKPWWQNTVQKYVVYAMTLVGLSMLVADLTHTAFNSYKYDKVGHVGWFYAGNELGAIMSICFPIVVLFAIKNTATIKKSYYWIPAVLLIYSLMAIGTKVGFGSVLITLVISLAMLIVEFFRKGNTRQHLKINLFINLIIFAVFALYIPFSPIAKNTAIHLTLLENKEPPTSQEETPAPEKEQELSNQQIEDLVLSSRGAFLEQQKEYFKDAPVSQKVLGMGYAGNYKETPKMVEMDFYDLFFSFGILGFLLYFIPFIRLAIEIAIKVLRNLKSHFTIENVLVASGIVLGLGIAFSAGHVFTAPAVSIYLAILVAYLYVRVA
ncbi:hypothetical protein QE429_001156 [Bacillus sp. SORGH_AS 510]|uniref:O-antigen ligase family protein n=1 Tax=Bacillus sp. SORGH_AS_0510 TaxID=3041771 RepID=UPI002780ABB3|nr:O-antigen ligase family protein [Bacillus sp. SORGH_AS_0510]MDQ1144329.1 hypothetical protein [Bacillus sp. SORGH_AS_0510]